MRAWWWVVVVVAAAAGAWWYVSGDSAEAPAAALERTAVVRRGDLVVSITATGAIEPIEQVDVKSKASGEIIVLPVQEGDYVHRGDLIARLDRTTAQNDFDQATADHAVARVTRDQREKDLKRQQDLFDRGLVAESVLDEARLAFEQANAQLVRTNAILSTAAERLQDTEIRAPIDGVVLTRPVEVGQIISSGTTTVTGGTLLCTIAKMSQVYVVADVDETDIGKVTPDLLASISADAYPEVNLEGRVLRIAPLAKVEQNVTMFEVTVLVDNERSLLKAGMNATVEVVMDRSDGTLLIPSRAVEYRTPERRSGADIAPGADTGAGVRAEGAPQHGPPSAGGPAGENPGARPRGRMVPWVQVRREGQLEWTRVRTGLSNLDQIEVVEGLAEGDTVVYSLVSGAMQSREAFRDRMRSRNNMSGMRGGS